MLRLRPILVGLASYIKPAQKFIWKSTGGTVSARYCYSVWLRHLCLLHAQKKPTRYRKVAELGPGDSLGLGLMAMLTATNHYVGLDIVNYASSRKNVEIFDELIELLRERAWIPDHEEFPGIVPELESYAFPVHILTDKLLNRTLDPDRLNRIRAGLRQGCLNDTDLSLRYVVPWNEEDFLETGSIDLIYSQAVLEHVDDLYETYQFLSAWLVKEGIMSHTIGLTDHGLTSVWNGHYAIPEFLWKIIRGKRPYLINRHPLTVHLRLMDDCGLIVTHVQRRLREDGVDMTSFAPAFRGMSADDARTEAGLIHVVKKQ